MRTKASARSWRSVHQYGPEDKSSDMDYEITAEEVKGKLDGEVPSRAHQELDPDDHIVVVCHHGVRSMNVTVWLRQQGFEKAQSMRGGIDAWSRRVDQKVPVY